MKPKKECLRNLYYNSIVPSLLQIPEDVNLRNMEDRVLEPEFRNPIDDQMILCYLLSYYTLWQMQHCQWNKHVNTIEHLQIHNFLISFITVFRTN